MQLTEIQKLTQDYTDNDLTEMAAVMQSTYKSSAAAELRSRNVKPADAQAWLKTLCTSSLKEEFAMKRMSEMESLTDIPTIPYAEHLVVRDLDMEHMEGTGGNDLPGRVIAHADYRFAPSFSIEANGPESGINSTDSSTPFPEGFNKDLHMQLNSAIVQGVATIFGGLSFFSLYGISTLTPSHLRKGIAKKMVQWVYPYADQFALPVVLFASPSGLFLYRSCGFEEYRDHDVTLDLGQWGCNEIHRHVVMVRWPKDDERMPAAWKEWRSSHKAGQPAQDV